MMGINHFNKWGDTINTLLEEINKLNIYIKDKKVIDKVNRIPISRLKEDARLDVTKIGDKYFVRTKLFKYKEFSSEKIAYRVAKIIALN